MSKEKWKDIVGYVGYYQISNLGRVKSIERFITASNGFDRLINGCILKSQIIGGYFTVTLCINHTQKMYKVHRLLAEYFIPNPLNLPHVNHVDNDQLNNDLSNLEWVSIRENNLHRYLFEKTSSKYPGVYYNKEARLFRAQIQVDGKKIYLGKFEDEKEAGNAYRQALIKYNIINRYSLNLQLHK
jgi:hypothetical protein